MKGLTIKGLRAGAFSSSAGKISISLLTILLLSLFCFSTATANDDAENSIPPASSKRICTMAVSGGRELGLLVLGIGWEAVRIVLPEARPEKDKDIDELIISIKERKSKLH
ncbi:MAG: hypothetical protein JW984_06540 [Deltaproteobacteria bacterium]|uniref:Uncharacterized protein n=1 Tax=Candidatus Zymogenus saltonus TaxID=2844893 RepID=A0A9D8PPD4_9DELT|nr:hypothetical protein [Candidatus Zymogenus saltonus]